MSMRLLADHCVPRSVIEALRLAGHDVVRLKAVPACGVTRLGGDCARLVAYLSDHPDREQHRAKLVIVEAAQVRVRA